MHKIVIPDVHQNLPRLFEILEKPVCKEAEEIIFLGDYFDSFDYDYLTLETCKFLNDNINNLKYTFLLGNHDIHYLSSVSGYKCSGWSFQKQSVIDVNLSKEFKRKVKPFKYEKICGEHVLFSHAGLHPSFAPIHFDELLKNDKVKDWFDDLEIRTMDNFVINKYDTIFGAGKDRGGFQKIGGITWLDWYSFTPIDNLNQVLGHSQVSYPGIVSTMMNTRNINIDTNLNYFLKIDMEGELFFEIC